MPLFKAKGASRGKKTPTVLERRTAELKEKLGRISFRRHSAPAEGSARDIQDEPEYYGGSLKPRVDPPVVLDQLPTPILELILGHLSLKELISSAALVHTSWRHLILDEQFWRRRLAGKLPQELISHFNRWHNTWIPHAARFFSTNHVSNREFSPQKMSVATGFGKMTQGTNSWRVQVSCWQCERVGVPASDASVPGSLRNPLNRALVLTTPTWASPEAVQRVNLLECLTNQGLSPSMAAAYLDSSPPIHFSVWCHTGRGQPNSWHRGYAVCVLDNGRDSATGWLGLREGSRMSMNESAAHWISWAPEDTLLRGVCTKPREYAKTPRGEFRKLSCVFTGYRQGVRRAHILLKGLSPQQIYPGKDSKALLAESGLRPSTEFVAPTLRFGMPDV